MNTETSDHTLDWDKAVEHLETAEKAYTSIGQAGMFALQVVIMPCRERYNKGERTQGLYDQIMDISL